MKRKTIILGVLTLLCIFWTGGYSLMCYEKYLDNKQIWNKRAEASFEESLWLEVNKRADIPIQLYSSVNEGMVTLNKMVPDSVSIMTMEGFRKFKIDKDKYENSLIKGTLRRGHLGALLELYPLSIDTLAMHWDSLLVEKQIPLSAQIRYIFTDIQLQNDTTYSEANNKLQFDSLSVCYLGFRCEHELTAFVSYPHWLLALSAVNWFLGLLPWGMLCFLMVFYARIERFIRNRFVKELVVEKVVHVADVPIDQAKFYQLPDGSLFDSFAGTITKGDLIHTLPPQSARLLRLFICKENHRLTTAEIEIELWNGNGSLDKIHKVIQRLRSELKQLSPDLVIKNVNGEYELK